MSDIERDERDQRERYEPKVIEPKWQAYWDEHKTFAATRHPGREKMYILDMFPYPSGSGLHVGHPEGYTATDIIARYKRMKGVDVLHPMGWDAFGLPAEQYAIRTGVHPRDVTLTNINTFRRQLKMLGFSYDWDREVDTTDPGYVRWTQWIFLKLFERGLAFQQSDMPVNWCPALGTVLANDEVVDGKSEVGGHPVEKLKIRQWSLRITEYADRLDEELAALDWPDTKVKQHNWIGRSEGANVTFDVAGSADKITVFTTRVDTLPGATYVVIAPEHPLADKIATSEHAAAVAAYRQAAAKKSDIDRSDVSREKTGVPTGAFAENPINGDKLPIWVGDYVIGSYGTGAVMAVPAHDERDHAFAVKYDLPILEVVNGADGKGHDVSKESFNADGTINDGWAARSRCELPAGTKSEDARAAVTRWLAERQQGSARVTYKLRDWVFSRQRYWGEPIPIYFPVTVEGDGDPRKGAKCTIHYETPIAVPDSELPLRLPDLQDFKPSGDPEGPLARVPEWRFFQKDGKWFARETNTMPQWAGSCWYYLRFLDPKNTAAAFSKEAYDAWMPVDLYVGGSEQAVLHLLYARFWHKVLFDVGVVTHKEPFIKLVHQGIILGEPQLIGYQDQAAGWVTSENVRAAEGDIHVRKDSGATVTPKTLTEADVVRKGPNAMLKENEAIRVQSVAFKMSKSRGNVINPDDIVKVFGADALRMYEMFMGPLEQMKPWQTSGIEGISAFLKRVFTVCTNVTDDAAEYDLDTQKAVHKTLKKVTLDIEQLRFNTAISAMMILVRQLGQKKAAPRAAAKLLALMLSPFAPHLGEELWQRLGGAQTLAYEPWPAFDAELVTESLAEIGVQVNGKLRGVLSIAVDADEPAARELALADEKIAAFITGKAVKKVVYVPGKILNFIVA
jgi:leucyl-tRNA synthetase